MNFSMKWESTILWVALFCLELLKIEAVVDDHLNIWCIDDSQRNETDLMKYVGNDLQSCTFEEIDDYPFSWGPVKTPAAPESFMTLLKVYNTSDATSTIQIAVFMSWRYKKEYFKDVDQFHIEMNDMTVGVYGMAKQFIFMWDGNLTEAVENSTAQFLRFHFIYAGRDENGEYYNKPRNEMSLRLQGLPMYSVNTEPQDAWTDVKIPGCDDPKIRKSQKCDEARKCKPEQTYFNDMCITPRRRRRPPPKKSSRGVLHPQRKMDYDPLLVLAATVGCVAFLALIGCFIWCQTRRLRANMESPRKPDDKARVLLVCTKDNGFIDAINQLIEMIMETPNVDVVCNLRQRTEIGMHGIQEWTKKEVRNSDVICFVVANKFEISKPEGEANERSRLDDVEKHQLAIVMSAIETMVISKALENSPKKFIVLDLGNCVKKETLPYFTRYKLPGDFKKFFKCIPGKIAESQKKKMKKEKKVFFNLLSNAHLGYSHAISGYNEENEISIANIKRFQHLKGNDLDEEENKHESCDGIGLESGNDFSLNIPTSAPSSYDFPRSDDFNHSNDIEPPRYIQAGARPKQINC